MKKRKSMYIWTVRLKSILVVFSAVVFSIVISGAFQVAETGAKAGKRLPVLMYHSILNEESRAGDYIITPEMFESDLKKIKERGYTTVNCGDLIDYVYNGKELPEKPVMITFDDGNYNNYTYALPLLEKYDMKCVISVVGAFSDMYSSEGAIINDRYSYLSYDLIKEMAQSGRVEFGNHSYYMHNMSKRKGVLKQKGENEDMYKNILTADVEKLQDTLFEKCGVLPVAFAYPYGAVNNRAKSIVEELGFKVTLGCEEGMNNITSPDSLYDLKRYNRSSKFDISKILS